MTGNRMDQRETQFDEHSKFIESLNVRSECLLTDAGVQLDIQAATRLLRTLESVLPANVRLADFDLPVRVLIWPDHPRDRQFAVSIERMGWVGSYLVTVYGSMEELKWASETLGLCILWDANGRTLSLNKHTPDVESEF